MKTIFKNIFIILEIMFYFFILAFAYHKMNLGRLMEDIKVFSGMFLIVGIIALEKAYREDKMRVGIAGIELIALSMYSLSVIHIMTFFKDQLIKYLSFATIIFALYYIIKAIILVTIEKKHTLKQLSDISEIVKDEPIKKEATKKSARQ